MPRLQLTGNTQFHVDPVAGDDANDGSKEHPWKRAQYGLDYMHDRVDRCEYSMNLKLHDGHYQEVLAISEAGSARFIFGNPSNPRAVKIDGLQVRDHAVCLFYDISLPWLLLSQNAVVDAFNFVLCDIDSPLPTGYQIACDKNSNLNLSNYSVDASASGHMYAGQCATIAHASGATVTLANWLSLGTFIRAAWGASVDIGSGVNWINGAQVTATPVDTTHRGIVCRAGNAIPGSLFWPVIAGDGLIL